MDLEYIVLLALMSFICYRCGHGEGESLGTSIGTVERIRLMERIEELEKKIEDIELEGTKWPLE